ncbi:MAG TPA: hypothetical protein VIF64_14560 [Pyrinomonadaceae bacterium]|jgi:hypothetical protein
MPEKDQAESETKKPKKNDRNPLRAAKLLFTRLPIGLRRITVSGLIGFLIIVGIAVLHPSLNERWKFGADMTLQLLILLAIAVQAYIYSGQWEAMQAQEQHMRAQVKILKETLVETKRIFDLTERPIIVVTDCDIKGGLAPNRPLRPIVTFVNKGRTAAQRFRVTVEIAAKPTYIWWFGFGDTGKVPEGDYFLPAGDPMLLVGAPADAVTIDADFYKRVAEGKEEFVVHGNGSYEDLAGREYPIEYAFQFHADGGFAHYRIRKKGETEENEKENPN